MRIAIVSSFYSEGMGYTENCLPRALAARGHDVHLITTVFNVYGNEPQYARTYGAFLGPSVVSPGTTTVDGYHVHRLAANMMLGYVLPVGLAAKVSEINPDIVHSLAMASLQTYILALRKPWANYALFTETHQHLSVVRSFLKGPGSWFRKGLYRMTRTLPTHLASRAVEMCYATAPDCQEVARRFYGVPRHKLKLQSLGADTDLFHPVQTEAEAEARERLRRELGYVDDDIVCVFSGRFSAEKNPLLLARAIDALGGGDVSFKGLFIGDGAQKDAILASQNTTVVPFMKHRSLAAYYRAADIAVWPTQESMSMLDAAASGLPIVVSNRVGEVERVNGNGRMYEENDVDSMVDVLRSLSGAAIRRALGAEGRRKMLAGYNWAHYARTLEADYETASRRSLLFIGPLPEPVTGQSLACRVLLEGMSTAHRVDVVDISKKEFAQGVSSLGRVSEVASILWRVWRKRRGANVIYLTVSQSVAGNLKDLVIYMICFGKLDRMVVHLFGGAGMRRIMLGDHPLLRAVNGFFLRRLAGVIVEGETQADIYRAAVRRERIHVVPNFAEDHLFVTPDMIVAKFERLSPLRILFLSNLLPGKGHDELIEAFLTLDERTKATVQIDLAGGFESDRQRDAFLSRIAGEERIRYHGVVAGEIKRALLAEAHVFCLPTYYPYEGQPVSILEAFASGCVVITTGHSGIPDVFRDGTNGFEVVPRSAADVRIAIERAARDPGQLRRIATVNLEAALARFRVATFQRGVGEVIDTVERRR